MAFLVFEGLDGAGKSTLIQGVASYLEDRSNKVLITREPGGTALGEEVREILLRVEGESPCPLAELLLYEAGRAQHVEKKIRPALQAGTWVLCDRFTASSVAFQAGGRGLALDTIENLNGIATGNLKADLTILLDLTLDEAQRRIQGRELDRFEQEKEDFHQRVRQSYLQQAQANPATWLVLDASKSPEDLIHELIAHIEARDLWGQ